jgi:hypothetical protein
MNPSLCVGYLLPDNLRGERHHVPDRFHNAAQRTQPSYATAASEPRADVPPLNTINNGSLEHLRAYYSQYEQIEIDVFTGSCSTPRESVMLIRVIWLMVATFRSNISVAKTKAAAPSETLALCIYHTTYHIAH